MGCWLECFSSDWQLLGSLTSSKHILGDSAQLSHRTGVKPTWDETESTGNGIIIDSWSIAIVTTLAGMKIF